MLVLSNIGAKVSRSVVVRGVHKRHVYRGYRLSSYAYVEIGMGSG